MCILIPQQVNSGQEADDRFGLKPITRVESRLRLQSFRSLWDYLCDVPVVLQWLLSQMRSVMVQSLLVTSINVSDHFRRWILDLRVSAKRWTHWHAGYSWQWLVSFSIGSLRASISSRWQIWTSAAALARTTLIPRSVLLQIVFLCFSPW